MRPSTAQLVVKDDIEKRTVNLQSAVIVDETKFPEFIHENIDATARRPHQFGQRFLRYFANDGFRLAFFSITSKQEKSTRQSFLAGIKKLVHQVGLHSEVTFEHVRYEAVCKFFLFVPDPYHFVLLDLYSSCRRHRRGRRQALWSTAADAALAKKIACSQ